VWKQIGGDRPTGSVNTDGYTLPWHMDTTTSNAQSSGGLSHSWQAQHLAWFEGAMTGWMAAQSDQSITMAYFTRDDIPYHFPYHFALADNFTVCDQYFCSVFGPTDPNRIVFMSGTIDPEGTNGGPVTDNMDSNTDGQLGWECFPETLQKAGVDWYLYQEGASSDNYTDNPLHYFAGSVPTIRATSTVAATRSSTFPLAPKRVRESSRPCANRFSTENCRSSATSSVPGRRPSIPTRHPSRRAVHRPDPAGAHGRHERVGQDALHHQLRRERRALRPRRPADPAAGHSR